jgi:NAD(P)H-dependent flavin oxidoreductase YrpB (nitropropane dioxygenase family)
MGAGHTNGELAAAVSMAGGLGVIGASFVPPEDIAGMIDRVRAMTDKPIGINLLLHATEERVDEILDYNPAVFSTAWSRDDQDLREIFARAHGRGAKVMHMVPTLHDAERAAEAGADVIVAQGTEGGGHVGLMGTAVIVRQVANAVAPIPVLAAGGLVDGAGLVAALALGASGVLLGTRFLATDEAPVEQYVKNAILRSNGEDTVVTTVGDTLTGRDWPGAYARVARTRFVERWLGREPELRKNRTGAWQALEAADEAGDSDNALMWFGQSAGLVERIVPAGEVVREIMRDAEEILRERLPTFLR